MPLKLTHIHAIYIYILIYLHAYCIQQEEDSFQQRTGLKFKEESSGVPHLEYCFYGAETWTFQKVDEKCLNIFKCGAREGRRRSVGPIV